MPTVTEDFYSRYKIFIDRAFNRISVNCLVCDGTLHYVYLFTGFLEEKKSVVKNKFYIVPSFKIDVYQ